MKHLLLLQKSIFTSILNIIDNEQLTWNIAKKCSGKLI